MYDLVIHGGQLVLETGILKANIHIKDGKIKEISSDIYPAKKKVNAEDMYVFPGGVDPHVHLNEPGLTERDDFYTGTVAAAAGGITTILEMPNSIPVTADKDSFLLKKEKASTKSIIDFGLYMALTPDNFDEVNELMELQPAAFKAFMSYSPTIKMVDDGYLLAGMEQLANAGGRIAVHCENNELINYFSKKLKQEGRVDPLAYAESRPPISEWEAIQRAVNFAKATGVHLHVVHSSTKEGAEIATQAREQGYSVSVETAPHYILMDLSNLVEKGPYALCKPPLRDESNKEVLWDYLEKDYINCLGSDHSAYVPKDKEAGIDNIWKSPAGFTGIQTMIPMFLGEGMKRGLSLTRMAELIATEPAKIFGYYPKKGTIQINSDADLFLFNPKESWNIEKENLLYKHKWTPYEGMTVQGRIKQTIVRGKTVYVDASPHGEITVEPGYGEFLPGTKTNSKDLVIST